MLGRGAGADVGRARAEHQIPGVGGRDRGTRTGLNRIAHRHHRRRRGRQVERVGFEFRQYHRWFFWIGDVENYIGRLGGLRAIGCDRAVSIDVDRDLGRVRAAAQAHPLDQHRAPATGMHTVVGEDLGVKDARRLIHGEDMGVVRARRPLQMGQQVLGDIGPQLRAQRMRDRAAQRQLELTYRLIVRIPVRVGEEAGIERVNHAVIGADVNYLAAVAILGPERPV